jgi:hypothetical protein
LLPHEFPPWRPSIITSELGVSTVSGRGCMSHCAGGLGVRLGRDPQPCAGVVDSQSVKTTGLSGEKRSYDPGKEMKVRKRHLISVYSEMGGAWWARRSYRW